MNNNVVFEKLNIISIIVGIILKIFFFNVYYRKSNVFQNNKILKKIINIINFKKLSFIDLNHSNFMDSISEVDFYEKNLSNDVLQNNEILNKFIQNENLNSSREKVYKAIGNSLGIFKTEFSTIYLINFYLKNKTIYFPENHNSLINLSLSNNNHRIIISGFFLYIEFTIKIIRKIFKSILMKLFIRDFSNIKNIQKNKINKNDVKILYFPHDSLTYGDSLFKKTFIYKICDNKKIFKKNILTVFFNDITAVDKKFFYLNSLNYYIYNDSALNITSLMNNTKKIFSMNKNFLLNIYILIFIVKYHSALRYLNEYPNLKIIYIYYDYLFNKNPFLIACEKKKIKSVSHLERGLLSTYHSPLFFNDYIVPSNAFKNFLKSKGFLIDNYHNFGFLRQKLASTKRIEKKKIFEKFQKIKDEKKLIFCIGTLISNTSGELYGNKGNSLQSNASFLENIVTLSKIYQNCYFVIKYKNQNFIKQLDSNLTRKINQQENIEILKNSKHINSYELVIMSDLIISKYSNILDETISLEKKIICYDDQKDLKSTKYLFNSLKLNTYNKNDLEKKFEFFLNNKDYYSINQKNLIETFFGKKKFDTEESIIKLIRNMI